MQPTIHAGRFASLAFIANVDLARWIFPDEHGGKTGANAGAPKKRRDLRRDFALHFLGELFPVKKDGHALRLLAFKIDAARETGKTNWQTKQ